MNIETPLAQLEMAQLVRRISEEDPLTGTGQGVAYLFKHALTQESAYASLLLKRRREIHLRIAQTYAQAYPDRLDEDAGLLAHHFAEGGDDIKTIEYATRAGDLAAAHSANPEARSYYDQALKALSHLSDDNQNRRRHVDVSLKRMAVSLRAEGPEKSLVRLREVEGLALELLESEGTREDQLQVARIHYWMGHALLHGNDPREAIRYLKDALSVAETYGGDVELLAIPRAVIGRALAIQGHFDRAETLLKESIPLLEETGNLNEWFMTVGSYGFALAGLGNVSGALAAGKRLLPRALELNHLTGIAMAHGFLAMIAFLGGDLTLALEESAAGVLAARRSGDETLLFMSSGYLAWAQIRLGQNELGLVTLMEARQRSRQLSKSLVTSDTFAAAEAEIALNAGRMDEAVELAKGAVKYAQSVNGIFAEGLAHRTWAVALAGFKPAPLEEALEHLATSLRIFESGGARLEAARTHVAWGTICQMSGDYASSQEHFEKAAAQFEASGLEAELSQARQLIAQVEARA